jgi:plasmid stabilization system protein ParE
MDCKIVWSLKALQSFDANIEYLQTNWTDKEIRNFVELVDKKVVLLSKQPQIGSIRNLKYKNIRTTLIHKRVILIYRYQPTKNLVELLLFWNTAKDPKKINDI